MARTLWIAGVATALALKRIKGMTIKTGGQLFTATMPSICDYASSIWSVMMTTRAARMLEQVQRIGAQAIVGAFRTVSLARTEIEAGIEPLQTRLQRQQHKFWVKKAAEQIEYLTRKPSAYPASKTKRATNGLPKACSYVNAGLACRPPELLQNVQNCTSYCFHTRDAHFWVDVLKFNSNSVHASSLE